MHEMHVIKNLFQDLLKLADENNTRKITNVYLKMGLFTEINPEILTYFFKEQGKGTPLESAKLHFADSDMRELKLVSFDCE
ncbi:MAG: hydrogenase maturation nickel metallochaperone HypA [Candidatus Omnitrophica bacterium]|nr:hydrogenase maturation nickel metallochaperone HypA [Candidatus Omnitrophota bacterium]